MNHAADQGLLRIVGLLKLGFEKGSNIEENKKRMLVRVRRQDLESQFSEGCWEGG